MAGLQSGSLAPNGTNLGVVGVGNVVLTSAPLAAAHIDVSRDEVKSLTHSSHPTFVSDALAPQPEPQAPGVVRGLSNSFNNAARPPASSNFDVAVVDHDDEINQEKSLYEQGNEFVDERIVCLPLSSLSPTSKLDSQAKWKIAPRKVQQLNEITRVLAKSLNVSVTSNYPAPNALSRVLTGGKTYPSGAFIMHFDTIQHAQLITNKLAENKIEVTQYKPIMSRIESSGWPINYTPDRINDFIYQQAENQKLYGLLCYHTLPSKSSRGN